MGSFVFKWPHPDAKDVHVTGTFDDWSKSEQLNKVGDTWEKEVDLPSADQKYLYKFVVDDQWIIDHTAPQEDDGNHNVNNVLHPDQIKKKEAKEAKESTSTATGVAAGAGAAGLAAGVVPAISSAAPKSTSSDLAAKAPLEEAREAVPAVSSAAPTSTTAGLAAKAPLEESRSAVPGAFPETPSNEPEAFGVAPIPASGSGVNPINLKPGEPVPPHSEVTPHTVDSTVTTSKEDYEKAGSSALPIIGGTAAGLGAGAAAAAAFTHGDSKKNLIPESSLPMGRGASDLADAGPTLASAAPLATTAGLAGGVPLEKKRQAMVIDPEDAPKGLDTDSGVPAAVKESVAESHVDPEAAASAEAVKEKSAFEKELLSKTPISQAAGESASAAAGQTSYYGLATSVPKTVEESMAKAHSSPEAAAEASVVAEKSQLEKELLSKVPSTDEAGEPAPTIASATSATAPATTAAETTATGAATTPVSKATEAIGGAAAAVGGVAAAGAAAVGLSSGAKPSEHAEKSVPGTSPSAAAAVSDGTGKAATPIEAPKTSAVAEKTEAAITEYAPPKASSAVPGVSSTAAAAVSDGTAHSTLAEEPAVKMMKQNEAASTAPKAAVSTPAAPAATSTPQTSKVAAPAVATTPQASKVAAPAVSTSTPAAASTPTKKVAEVASSSPATSSTTDKKKKHRVSSFFKKIFD